MSVIKVNCVGEICPVPLVEMRKATRKAKEGDVIEITGNHPSSKKEIPMAVEAMGLKIEDVKEDKGIWTITIRR